MASRLEQQINVWTARKGKKKKRAILEILEAALNNADVAIRQRKQKTAVPTIAADLDENFLGKPILLANAAYDRVARELRLSGCQVQRDLKIHNLAQMKFHVIKAVVGLEQANPKKIRKKLDEVRARLRKGKHKPRRRRRKK